MRGVLGLIREHRVSIGVNYATLFVNALALDGMAAVLYPTYNVLDAARPLLTSCTLAPSLAPVPPGRDAQPDEEPRLKAGLIAAVR